MQIRKKQLLGALGLLSVAVMTAIALSLPVNEAAAYSDSGSATVQVTVVNNGTNPPGPGGDTPTPGPGPSPSPTPSPSYNVSLDNLEDGQEIVSDKITLRGSYDGIDRLSIYGTYTTADGKTGNFTIANNEPVSGSGTFEKTFNLTQYDIPFDSDVVINLVGYGSDGQTWTDTVQVRYRAMKVDVDSITTNSAGEPEVVLQMSTAVHRVRYMLYNKNHEAMFVGTDGQPEFQYITYEQLTGTGNAATSHTVSRNEMSDGTVTVTMMQMSDGTSSGFATLSDGVIKYTFFLPMLKYKVPYGEYELVVEGYDEDGDVIALNTRPVYYGVDIPDVPGTGALGNELNISRTDFIVTGLIAFGSVAGFAMWLVARKNKR